MRLNDVLILLAPVVIAIVAAIVLLQPGVILPAGHTLSPVEAVPTPAAGGPAAAGSPVAEASAVVAAQSGGSNSTGASGAVAATAVPTKSEAAGQPAAAAATGNPDRGKELFVQRGCSGCHTIADIPGAAGKVGPELTKVASVAGTRKPGMSAEAYIRESIENPTAFTVPGFPQGVMPPKLVSGADEDDVVAMLLQHK